MPLHLIASQLHFPQVTDLTTKKFNDVVISLNTAITRNPSIQANKAILVVLSNTTTKKNHLGAVIPSKSFAVSPLTNFKLNGDFDELNGEYYEFDELIKPNKNYDETCICNTSLIPYLLDKSEHPAPYVTVQEAVSKINEEKYWLTANNSADIEADIRPRLNRIHQHSASNNIGDLLVAEQAVLFDKFVLSASRPQAVQATHISSWKNCYTKALCGIACTYFIVAAPASVISVVAMSFGIFNLYSTHDAFVQSTENTRNSYLQAASLTATGAAAHANASGILSAMEALQEKTLSLLTANETVITAIKAVQKYIANAQSTQNHLSNTLENTGSLIMPFDCTNAGSGANGNTFINTSVALTHQAESILDSLYSLCDQITSAETNSAALNASVSTLQNTTRLIESSQLAFQVNALDQAYENISNASIALGSLLTTTIPDLLSQLIEEADNTVDKIETTFTNNATAIGVSLWLANICAIYYMLQLYCKKPNNPYETILRKLTTLPLNDIETI